MVSRIVNEWKFLFDSEIGTNRFSHFDQRGICSKVSRIDQLEFRIAYFETVVFSFRRYAIGTAKILGTIEETFWRCKIVIFKVLYWPQQKNYF